jgi:hypothetical protein
VRVYGTEEDAGGLFFATAPIESMEFCCPTWNSVTGSMTISLYKWDTDYETTKKSPPAASQKYIDYPDNAWLSLECGVEAGEYLFVLSGSSCFSEQEHIGKINKTANANIKIFFIIFALIFHNLQPLAIIILTFQEFVKIFFKTIDMFRKIWYNPDKIQTINSKREENIFYENQNSYSCRFVSFDFVFVLLLQGRQSRYPRWGKKRGHRKISG